MKAKADLIVAGGGAGCGVIGCGVIAWISMIIASTLPQTHPALEMGNPGAQIVIEREGYVVGYDGMTRCPRWVAEKMTAESFAGDAPRRNRFREDESIPWEFRATLDDYRGSGYDRGHLAPHANHDNTVEASDETFWLTNMMPQWPKLNRREWAGLEAELRDLAEQEDVEAVWVFTGPAWFGEQGGEIKVKLIGESRIWVPNWCWKAWVYRAADGTYGCGTYLISNDDLLILPADGETISIDELERIIGLDLFSGLPDEIEDELESE